MKLFRHRANAGERASRDDARLRQALREIAPLPEDPDEAEQEAGAGPEEAQIEEAQIAAAPLPDVEHEEDDLTAWQPREEEMDYYKPRLRRSARLQPSQEESAPIAEPDVPPRRAEVPPPPAAGTGPGGEPPLRLTPRMVAPAQEPPAAQDMPAPPRAGAGAAPAQDPFSLPGAAPEQDPFSVPGADSADLWPGADPEPALEMPAPATGRLGRRADRAKTRILGFEHQGDTGTDPFETATAAETPEEARFPVGWLVVVDGPGRGAFFTLQTGVSAIGRGEDQAVRLDFGDSSISRSNHALLAYDGEQAKFFLGHGGKRNIVRLNDRPVLSTEEITDKDQIRIGETTLRFIALCGADFDWAGESVSTRHDASAV
mgnify:CR=1 FL=1